MTQTAMQAGLPAVQAAVELLMTLSTASALIFLFVLVRRRGDIGFGPALRLPAAFLAASVVTHAAALAGLHLPSVWLQLVPAAVTACLAVATASLLWELLPQLVSLPSPALLHATLAHLRATQERLNEADQWVALGERLGRVGHWHLGSPDRTLTWSEETYDIFGVEKEAFPVSLDTVLERYAVADRDRVAADIQRALATGRGFEHAARIVRPSGEVRHILSRARVRVDQTGRPASVYGVSIDTTEEHRQDLDRQERERILNTAMKTAERSESHYRLLADNVTDLVACIDGLLRWTFVSPSSVQVTGYAPEELMAMAVQDLVRSEDWLDLHTALTRLLGGTKQGPMQFCIQKRNGAQVWIEANGKLMPCRSRLILSMRDVTARKNAEDDLLAANERLQNLAQVDGLTGLSNRRRFDEAICAELRRCARYGLSLTLIMIDVDYFKAYNDTFGHQRGDRCLRLIAQTIDAFARRPGDVAARYGGEEFAIVLPGIAEADGIELAERLRAAVEALGIERGDPPAGLVTVSIGVTGLHPATGEHTVEALIAVADQLLYGAKQAGRNVVVATESVLPPDRDPSALD